VVASNQITSRHSCNSGILQLPRFSNFLDSHTVLLLRDSTLPPCYRCGILPPSCGFSHLPSAPGFSHLPSAPGFSHLPNAPAYSHLRMVNLLFPQLKHASRLKPIMCLRWWFRITLERRQQELKMWQDTGGCAYPPRVYSRSCHLTSASSPHIGMGSGRVTGETYLVSPTLGSRDLMNVSNSS